MDLPWRLDSCDHEEMLGEKRITPSLRFLKIHCCSHKDLLEVLQNAEESYQQSMDWVINKTCRKPRFYPSISHLALYQQSHHFATAGPGHPPVAPTCQAIQRIDAEGAFDQIGSAVAQSLKAIFKGYNKYLHIYIYIHLYLYYISIYYIYLYTI